MTVTRAGRELVSLKPELFADLEQLHKLALRTGGKLGMHRKALFDELNAVCLKDEFTLEWIPSKSDPRVGYIKMRPVSADAIQRLDRVRAEPYARRYKLTDDQAMRLIKVTKRNLVLKRHNVLDFAIANASRDDRPLDKEIFRVWVEDMCITQNRPRLNDEEKDTIFENLAAIRRALKKHSHQRKAPAPKPEEVNSVIENTPVDEPMGDSLVEEPGDSLETDEACDSQDPARGLTAETIQVDESPYVAQQNDSWSSSSYSDSGSSSSSSGE